MRIKIIMLLLAVFSFTGYAQEKAPVGDNSDYVTVVGAVIDVTGNPLPGALIKSKMGAQAVADADGTFTIYLAKGDNKLSAQYPGLKKSSKGIKKQPVVFELRMTPQMEKEVEIPAVYRHYYHM